MANATNVTLWNLCRKVSPSFKSHTAEATADMFTAKGFESISRTDISAVNEWFEISMRVAFQGLKVATAKNPLAGVGLVETYSTPNGGFTQRMAINSIKPISPAYEGLVNGATVDQQIVRKPEVSERFWQHNFSYQSLITLQDFQVKQVFVSDYGMSEFIAGIMSALETGYTIQEYENVMEALNRAINSVSHPLQDTQVLEMSSWTDAGVTDAELLEFIANAQDLATAMEISPQTDAFNAAKFKTAVSGVSNYVMLVRAGITNKIKRQLMVGAYNPDNLTIPFKIKEVEDFGGIQHYADISGTATLLYPHYDSLGEVDGWATSDGGDKAYDLGASEVYTVDPNADVLAVIAQPGLIFENIQNAYSVQPAPYNARGLYQNLFANAPQNTVAVDYYYNMVVIKKPQ